ncbi:hypothetical protein DFH06DRAFT_347699 [Mycena polygramma]|nr:hypothetical protein DFH06DRAFT_347699 [Mycena polygramma]
MNEPMIVDPPLQASAKHDSPRLVHKPAAHFDAVRDAIMDESMIVDPPLEAHGEHSSHASVARPQISETPLVHRPSITYSKVGPVSGTRHDTLPAQKNPDPVAIDILALVLLSNRSLPEDLLNAKHYYEEMPKRIPMTKVESPCMGRASETWCRSHQTGET